MRKHRRLALFAAGLSAFLDCGCALVRQVGAKVPEHDLYRQTRTAHTLEQRLIAAHAYEARYPDGAWSREVQAWLEPAHVQYLKKINDNLAALRGYRDSLPSAARARGIVARRVAELEVEEAYRKRLRYTFEVEAVQIQCELDRAARSRRRVVQEFMRFVTHISRIRTWGRPPSDLDEDLLRGLRTSQCGLERCTKNLALSYAITEDRQLSERVALFEVTMGLEEGRVQQAVVSGPELFSRIAEALDRRIVSPDDGMARVEAIATTLVVVQNALEAALPASECDRPPVSPVLILRECRGVRARMIAGRDATEEDRIVVEPLTSDE